MGEMSEDDAQPLHRSGGGSTYTRKARATREAPQRGQVSEQDQPDAREGEAGRSGVAERFVVPAETVQLRWREGPQFKTDAERGEGYGDWATHQLHMMFRSCRWRRTRKSGVSVLSGAGCGKSARPVR